MVKEEVVGKADKLVVVADKLVLVADKLVVVEDKLVVVLHQRNRDYKGVCNTFCGSYFLCSDHFLGHLPEES